MADYLIQRYIHNAPNETTGAWVDVGDPVRGLKADEEDKALDKRSSQVPPSATRVRVLRWDTTREYAVEPNPPAFTAQQKAA